MIPSKYVVFRAQACDSRHVISEIKFCYSFIPPVTVYAWLQPVFTALHGMQTQSSDENSVCLSVRSPRSRQQQLTQVRIKRPKTPYCSAPPACNHLFSSAAQIYTDRRSRLLPKRADMLLFVKHDLPIVKFNYGSISNK